MAVDLAQDLVPDGLWKTAAPLIPPFRPRRQGGGTAPVADRKVFTAVVYVLTSGCAWRYLPPTFGTSPATAHRRFAAWTKAGLWRRLHRAVLDELGAKGELDWDSAITDAASVRAKGGPLTGPNPVDRGKKGSKLHVLSEAQGIPLAVAVSGANVHDSQAFKPLLLGIPSIRPGAGHDDGDRSRFAPTRRTSPPNTSPGSAHEDSSRASHAQASSPASDSADTAGRSSGPSPGSSATADSPSDTSGKAPTSSLSSAWPPPLPATRSSRNSPRETPS